MQSQDVQIESMQLNEDDDPGHRAQQIISDQQSIVSEDNSTSGPEVHKKRKQLKSFTKKTKERTKKVFHVNDQVTSDNDPDVEGIKIIENDPAFDPGVLWKQQEKSPEATGKTHEKLHSVAATILHPKQSMKNKATKVAAGKLSSAERPYLSRNADLEFLNAHKEMNQAGSSESSLFNKSADEANATVHDYRSKVAELEAHRESLRVAWMTSRHMNRVQVISKPRILYPDTVKFYANHGNGSHHKFDWLNWLGHYLLYFTQDFSAQYVDDFDELPFDVNSLRHHIERIVVASASWQTWAMSVRSVYRWENPYNTGKWLAIYLILWYTEHVIAFIYGYIIYIVIKNLYFPTSVQSLESSMQRAHDDESKAYKLRELVDKYGDDSWLEPLLDNLGPYIQLQMSDIANMLEVFHNFYHWKSPRKTAASLVFFVSCLLISLVADMRYCMKIVWFISGGTFFFCWPIASLYPKYRYLVSPFKWVLWDIPTDAEWSCQYLRRQAQISRERIVQTDVKTNFNLGSTIPSIINSDDHTAPPSASSTPESETEDPQIWHDASPTSQIFPSSTILSFRAHSNKKPGNLIIHSSGMRFERRHSRAHLWAQPFSHLTEMRKLEGSAVLSAMSLRSHGVLELSFDAGEVLRLERMRERERDRAFNAIIGFSTLRWKVLQMDLGTGRGKGKGGEGEGGKGN